MPFINLYKRIAVVSAIICAVGAIIVPADEIFLPFGIYNLFNYMLLCYIEGKYEQAQEKAKKRKKKERKDSGPKD